MRNPRRSRKQRPREEVREPNLPQIKIGAKPATLVKLRSPLQSVGDEKRVHVLVTAAATIAKNPGQLQALSLPADKASLAMMLAVIIEELGFVVTFHPPIVIEGLPDENFDGYRATDETRTRMLKAAWNRAQERMKAWEKAEAEAAKKKEAETKALFAEAKEKTSKK